MAFIETEDFIDWIFVTWLECYHLATPGRQTLIVGGVLKLAIPLVAGALARVLAAVQAVAEGLTLGLVQVLPDVGVVYLVNLDILRKKKEIRE